MTPVTPVTPADLTGCRRRSVLLRAAAAGRITPELPASARAERHAHRQRTELRRDAVNGALPTEARRGDRVKFSRVDVTDDGTAEEQTLEALAAGVRVITGARLADGALACDIDLLVRLDDSAGLSSSTAYMPVTVTAHTTARRVSRGDGAAGQPPGRHSVRVIDVAALGLSAPVDAPLRHRSNAVDSQKVAVAHVLLDRLGLASGDIGFIGGGTGGASGAGGYNRCVVIPADRVLGALERALAAPVPARPVRVRECGTCEFHNHCRRELVASSDLSLMLPGDRGRQWRELGVHTLPDLAALADRPAGLQLGPGVSHEDPALAAAWLAGVEFLRRPLRRWITRPELWCGHPFRMPGHLDDGELPMAEELADAVEIDVDMEAHPSRGTFLWGTFDGSEYRPFTDFSRSGDEGEHVARYWTWLMARRRAAHDSYRVFRAYCYSQQGENHWMRSYATRFGGREYAPGIVMPTLADVNAFLDSSEWVDVFALVKTALAANGSLGLKSVAALAGFTFSQQDVDGRAAVDLFEIAVGDVDGDDGSPAGALAEASSRARRTLERYNADDCYAPAAVRRWLRLGAPGVPPLEY
ncbi:ribonuclease H-like domain-containing protein [uncultured Corynebacterium sp.]|uniref:ribonuclease H-like domain-containing protein n=1 Tax=uncultured Corynebacterium sp. TaxID=159447 RepID=UPI0025F5C089|nr:ribonuclease H-like domain-containing protein [uncultured Corynebacterium sp.]